MFSYRPKPAIYQKISNVVAKAMKFEKSSPTKANKDKIKGFQKVCDISATIGHASSNITPLSPKRVESPVTPELGRGKRLKTPTSKCKSGCSSELTTHGESKV